MKLDQSILTPFRIWVGLILTLAITAAAFFGSKYVFSVANSPDIIDNSTRIDSRWTGTPPEENEAAEVCESAFDIAEKEFKIIPPPNRPGRPDLNDPLKCHMWSYPNGDLEGPNAKISLRISMNPVDQSTVSGWQDRIKGDSSVSECELLFDGSGKEEGLRQGKFCSHLSPESPDQDVLKATGAFTIRRTIVTVTVKVELYPDMSTDDVPTDIETIADIRDGLLESVMADMSH